MSSPQTKPIDELPQPTMRWRYFEPGIAAEEAQRARVEARLAAFWNDFVASAPRLDANFRGVEPWPEWVKWIDLTCAEFVVAACPSRPRRAIRREITDSACRLAGIRTSAR